MPLAIDTNFPSMRARTRKRPEPFGCSSTFACPWGRRIRLQSLCGGGLVVPSRARAGSALWRGERTAGAVAVCLPASLRARQRARAIANQALAKLRPEQPAAPSKSGARAPLRACRSCCLHRLHVVAITHHARLNVFDRRAEDRARLEQRVFARIGFDLEWLALARLHADDEPPNR